jgi:hypothetical protein
VIALRKPLIAIFALLLLAGTAYSSIVFDNGPPNSNSIPNLVSGRKVKSFVSADDFTLGAATTITDAHFWTFELSSPPWDGTLQWFIFNDRFEETPAVGPPLASGNGVAVAKLPTGNTVGPYVGYAYDFVLDTPVSLPGGTRYWFGLHLSSDFAEDDILGEILWERTSAAFGSSPASSPDTSFTTWFFGGDDLAFYLTDGTSGGVVPELSSLVTWGLLISAIGAVICKRRCWTIIV